MESRWGGIRVPSGSRIEVRKAIPAFACPACNTRHGAAIISAEQDFSAAGKMVCYRKHARDRLGPASVTDRRGFSCFGARK